MAKKKFTLKQARAIIAREEARSRRRPRESLEAKLLLAQSRGPVSRFKRGVRGISRVSTESQIKAELRARKALGGLLRHAKKGSVKGVRSFLKGVRKEL